MKPDTAIYTAYDDHTPSDSSDPEKNLMRAILRTAIEDVRGNSTSYLEARRYILANDDMYLFSFLSICYQLNLCSKTIRTRLGLSVEENEEERMRA